MQENCTYVVNGTNIFFSRFPNFTSYIRPIPNFNSSNYAQAIQGEEEENDCEEVSLI